MSHFDEKNVQEWKRLHHESPKTNGTINETD